jgi:hypothetical protein
LAGATFSVDFVFDSAPATAFFRDDFLLGDFGSQLVRVSSVQFLAQGSFLPPLRALAGSAQDLFFCLQLFSLCNEKHQSQGQGPFH